MPVHGQMAVAMEVYTTKWWVILRDIIINLSENLKKATKLIFTTATLLATPTKTP